MLSVCATPSVNGLNEARVDDPEYFPFLRYSDVTDSYGSVTDEHRGCGVRRAALRPKLDALRSRA